MHIFESTFWTNFLLVLGVFIILLFSFNTIIRKLLKVERKKFFSYNHVNDKHKKVDWTIRISFIVIIVIWYFINTMLDFKYGPSSFNFLFLLFIITSEIVRAYMERNYSKNKNDYIFTISQLVFCVIFLLVLYTTDFFGLLG